MTSISNLSSRLESLRTLVLSLPEPTEADDLLSNDLVEAVLDSVSEYRELVRRQEQTEWGRSWSAIKKEFLELGRILLVSGPNSLAEATRTVSGEVCREIPSLIRELTPRVLSVEDSLLTEKLLVLLLVEGGRAHPQSTLFAVTNLLGQARNAGINTQAILEKVAELAPTKESRERLLDLENWSLEAWPEMP